MAGYRTRRHLTMGEMNYRAGEQVDVRSIPPVRLGSMLRLGMLQLEPELPDLPPDTTCDVCNEGPFRRVDNHRAAVHGGKPKVEVEPEAAAEPSPEEEEAEPVAPKPKPAAKPKTAKPKPKATK